MLYASYIIIIVIIIIVELFYWHVPYLYDTIE